MANPFTIILSLLPEPGLLALLLQQDGGNKNWSFVFLLLMVLVFYFLVIMPQMRRQRREKQFRGNLKKDEKVITIGGVYGRIVGLNDKTVMLDIGNGTRIRVKRSAILEYAGDPKEGKPEDSEDSPDKSGRPDRRESADTGGEEDSDN